MESEFVALKDVRNDQSEIVGAAYPVRRFARWIVNDLNGMAE